MCNEHDSLSLLGIHFAEEKRKETHFVSKTPLNVKKETLTANGLSTIGSPNGLSSNPDIVGEQYSFCVAFFPTSNRSPPLRYQKHFFLWLEDFFFIFVGWLSVTLTLFLSSVYRGHLILPSFVKGKICSPLSHAQFAFSAVNPHCTTYFRQLQTRQRYLLRFWRSMHSTIFDPDFVCSRLSKIFHFWHQSHLAAMDSDADIHHAISLFSLSFGQSDIAH